MDLSSRLVSPCIVQALVYEQQPFHLRLLLVFRLLCVRIQGLVPQIETPQDTTRKQVFGVGRFACGHDFDGFCGRKTSGQSEQGRAR